jgi:hypothetical protein
MRFLIIVFFCFCISSCLPQSNYYDRHETPSPRTSFTLWIASYSFSLAKVERPEKATQRYGSQKFDTLSTGKYSFYFEDDMIRALWTVSTGNISFSIQNKTDHSIKVPWDEAAFIDEFGSSHRVMHSGIKYNDKQQPQAPSIIARRASIEDLVFPTDYVNWKEGSRYTAGKWEEKPFFPNLDFQSELLPGKYSTFAQFDQAVKSKSGKTVQVLLPLQIEDVINDYIFTFKVDSVSTSMEKQSI